MKKNLTLLSPLIILLILGIYAFIFFFREVNLQEHFGFDKTELDTKQLLLRISLLAFFTLFGILCKVFYDQLAQEKDDGFNVLKVFHKTINSRQAWMSLIVCPIIILGFYKTIQDIDSYPLISLLAFQNGFFFKSILSNKKELNIGEQA